MTMYQNIMTIFFLPRHVGIRFSPERSLVPFPTYGPDRLESIIFDITEKKIDNLPSHLILGSSL